MPENFKPACVIKGLITIGSQVKLMGGAVRKDSYKVQSPRRYAL